MPDEIKVHILFPFREGPWGGSNQFLAALRDRMRAMGAWADTPDDADVVLFDSFNFAQRVIAAKRRWPAKPFVHRINGPVSIYRGGDRHVDTLIHALATSFADGVVFQSRYSQEHNLQLGMEEPRYSTVIMNAANEDLFNPRGRTAAIDGRLRILTTSWSANWNKGFDVYRHLDETLDFTRFSMTFVGNSPIPFRNIHHLPPQDPSRIAEILRGADIFLTASRHESCSNALAEAIACGAVPVALRSGGQPEQVAGGGVLFEGVHDVCRAIEMAAANLNAFRDALPRRSMTEVAQEYLRFLAVVRSSARPPRRLSSLEALRLVALIHGSRLRGKADEVLRRLRPGGKPA